MTFRKAIEDAMWAGDTNKLQRIAPCHCCCDEHTSDDCVARLWYGCKGQSAMTRTDDESWARHYEKHHNMPSDKFYE